MANNRYLDAFMKQFPFEGLTYDDVTLVTQYADFLPDDASLETQLTCRQKMKIPFISAAMDTVTEAPMAIAMALAGGIGVIHKNLEEDDQAKQVAQVKNYLNGLIAKPVCFHASDDISFLRAEKRRQRAENDVKNVAAEQDVAEKASDRQSGDGRRREERQNRQRFREADLDRAVREVEARGDACEDDVDRGDHRRLCEEQCLVFLHFSLL